MDLTNNMRKSFASLSSAKGRKEQGLFMAQGTKCVLDTFDSFALECLLANEAWLEDHPALRECATVVKNIDLQRISTLTTPPPVIAIYHIPQEADMTRPNPAALSLALDCVQDPGNLGTIMRVSDWMGVYDIFASLDTVDVWSPKVVQATMGAISRVKVHYVDLPALLSTCTEMPIYGTFLDGKNIYQTKLTPNGIIIMGNEGNGISPQVAEYVNTKLLIPSYPPNTETSESLNVAVATAITLSEFRRPYSTGQNINYNG